MNLLARIEKLKSLIKPGLIALIPVFLGCDSATDPGTEFDLGTNIDVKVFELELPASNLYIDSLRTDDEDRILVGVYSDDLIGSVTSEGYFQYKFTSGTLPVETQTALNPNPPDTLGYDSVYLELEPRDLIPNGASSDLSFEVVQLTETLTDGLIYLASREVANSGPVGTFDQNVNLVRDTIYRIKLDDLFGRQLFRETSDAMQDSSEVIRFHEYQDLGLVPTAGSEAIANIDITSINTQLVLYMSGDADSVYTASFKVNGANYSHILRDRSSSDFGAIVENGDFDLPDGKTILDPLAGITTTFNLDGITQFFEDNPNIIINTAILDLDSRFLSRDTLESFRFHFRAEDGGFFGPGILVEQFSHIMMRDEGYLSSLNSPALASFNESTEKYSVSPILFFQTIYNNYHASGNKEVIYINPIEGDTVRISELVLVSNDDVTLQQAQFNNSGIKLRVFYTEVN